MTLVLDVTQHVAVTLWHAHAKKQYHASHRPTSLFAQSSADISLIGFPPAQNLTVFCIFTAEKTARSNSCSSKSTLLSLTSGVALGKSVWPEPFPLYCHIWSDCKLFGVMADTAFVKHVSKVQKITIWLSQMNWVLHKYCKGISKQQHYYTSLSLHLPLHHFLLLVTTLPFSLNHS